MIDPNADSQEKLRQARQAFEMSVSKYEDCNEERVQCARFHHNSAQHGQWPEKVREQLAQERRPFFTFNLTQTKVLSFIGMQRDIRKAPVPRPEGGTDHLVADVIGALSGRIRKKQKAGRRDAAVLKNGAIRGEGDGQIYVERDPRNPSWIDIQYKQLPPHQVHWDPVSLEQDHSDARFVAVDTWMPKSKFMRSYPEHAHHFDALSKGSMTGQLTVPDSDLEYLAPTKDRDTYSPSRCDEYYFDQKRKMIRVIAMEYKAPETEWFLMNPQTGLAKNLRDIPLRNFDESPMTVTQKREYLDFRLREGDMQGGEVISTAVDAYYWFHFVGSTELFDAKSPQPFDGFTVVPYCFFWDDDENIPYGMVRNLIDPGTQVNKSYCLGIELSANQSKPGSMVEENAVDDPEVLAEQLRTTGSVAVVKDGALSQQRFMFRPVPTASSASQARLENDVKMLDAVSGIYPQNENIHAAEAALTHQLRNHKSRLIHADPVEAFEDFQVGMEQRLVQSIVRAMPADQITYLLGNSDRFRVEQSEQGTVIYEIKPNPQDPNGEPQIVGMAPLEQFRTLDADIELEATGENSSGQSIELGFLMQMNQGGTPVDPALMFERGLQSRADRERAKKYAESAGMQAAAKEQQESQRLDAEIQTALETERIKVAEQRRHSQVEELIKLAKLSQEKELTFWELWEKSDEAEKSFLVERLKIEGQPARPATGG